MKNRQLLIKTFTLAVVVSFVALSSVLAPIAVPSASAATDAEIRSIFESHGWSTSPADGNYGFRLNQAYTELSQRDASQLNTIAGLVVRIQRTIDYIIPFLLGLGLLFVVYGVLRYISKGADEEKRKEARDFILWGILSLFIMLSVWGLVNILVNTFNLDNKSELVGQTYTLSATDETSLSTTPTDLIQFINRAQAIGTKSIIPFLFSIAVLIVIFGVVNYIREGDNEEKRASARAFIIWGIVSIFVMLSIWGFVNILVTTFGVDNSKTPPIPTLPTL